MRGTPFGRYELLRKIAAGGMAEIFVGRLWGEGGFFRDVVIKRLFRHFSENDRALRMFQYEARLLAELGHPSIPQVLDLGYADGTWYIAMEYVEGLTVADAWRAGVRLGRLMPMHVAVGIAMQVAEALHHAHLRLDRAGRPLEIVHRDVTPQNVMVTRDGVVKLMDFGVAATAARHDTEAGTVKGTFSYMAPEQVRGRRVDCRADVFSLGVILYELTTGTRLYRGNDVQVMTAIVESDAPPPSSRAHDYPPDLEAIVLGALARDETMRIPTAAEFNLHLEAFALRHGWLTGPRALAEYMASVLPSERVQEEDLAMVSASTDSEEWAQVDVDVAPSDGGMLSFLDETSQEVPAPPDRVTQDVADEWLEPTESDALHTSDSEPLEDLLGLEEPGSLPPLALDGFDEPVEGARPVVLLDTVKKNKAGDGDSSYMRDLGRRLSDEDDDGDEK